MEISISCGDRAEVPARGYPWEAAKDIGQILLKLYADQHMEIIEAHAVQSYPHSATDPAEAGSIGCYRLS